MGTSDTNTSVDENNGFENVYPLNVVKTSIMKSKTQKEGPQIGSINIESTKSVLNERRGIEEDV